MMLDPCLSGLSDFLKGFRIDKEAGCNQKLDNGLRLKEPFVDRDSTDLPLLPLDPNSRRVSAAPPEEDRPEDCDVMLNYITQILMEDDMDDKTCMFKESSALKEAERSFYDILDKKYPPSPSPSADPDQPHFYDAESSNDHFTNAFGNGNSKDSSLTSDLGEYKSTGTEAVPSDFTSEYTCHSSLGTSDGVLSILDGSVSSIVDGGRGFVESTCSRVQDCDFFSESESVTQFRRGVEEASKFLPNPNGNKLILDPGKRVLLPPGEPKGGHRRLPAEMETAEERRNSLSPTEVARVRKHLHGEDPDLEGGRSSKQSAVYTEAAERTEMLDMVLLSHRGGKGKSTLSALREALQNGVNKNGQSKGSSGGKNRGKKQGNKSEVVDLRTLLFNCAQAVADDDRTSANELLKKIKQHSTPFGDGNQRLAHYFAESIEARLDGTGSELYVGLSCLRRSAVDIIKAYHLYLAVCPFKNLSNFFSNRNILNVAEKATIVHIVDFGILYGFQWPSLIQTLSRRAGGPPKLRITGIEYPQRGFKPSARVEETGRRLADYARTFNVPFEYIAIAKKWESIQLEDLKIDRDEVLVVNGLYRFRSLLDETVMVESPRNAVFNLIRTMNPAIFILGVLNGAYSAPFFVTRFREALFHFSAIFDILDTNIPGEIHERMLLEREIFAREAMNVISCEGKERVERPETYKQWQIRVLRAGFKQIPLNPDIVKKVKDKVKSSYHKNFVIDEDGQWMLQGWKGRIVYALSSWRPVYDSWNSGKVSRS